MEFCKDRVFTAVNADELKPGDKVVVADDLVTLKLCVKDNSPIDTIRMIGEEDYIYRFGVKDNSATFALAYLVERAENCTNCGAIYTCAFQVREHPELEKCKNWKPKTEQKDEKKCEDCTIDEICVEGKKIYKDAPCPYHIAKPHYRPFHNTDELIKVWDAKIGTPKWGTDGDLTMPLIWVRDPKRPKVNYLINGLMGGGVHWGSYIFNMQELFDNFEFLDGSPCGVEE